MKSEDAAALPKLKDEEDYATTPLSAACSAWWLAGPGGERRAVRGEMLHHLIWPVEEDRTPWYPETVLVRKPARAWASAFLDVRDCLHTILSSP